jgi:hypothetical protein
MTKQAAAVNTNSLLINVPPHIGLSKWKSILIGEPTGRVRKIGLSVEVKQLEYTYTFYTHYMHIFIIIITNTSTDCHE